MFPVPSDSTRNGRGARAVSRVLRVEPPRLLEPSAGLTVSSAGSCSEVDTLRCDGATASALLKCGDGGFFTGGSCSTCGRIIIFFLAASLALTC